MSAEACNTSDGEGLLEAGMDWTPSCITRERIVSFETINRECADSHAARYFFTSPKVMFDSPVYL
jgi:hypothetical protein